MQAGQHPTLPAPKVLREARAESCRGTAGGPGQVWLGSRGLPSPRNVRQRGRGGSSYGQSWNGAAGLCGLRMATWRKPRAGKAVEARRGNPRRSGATLGWAVEARHCNAGCGRATHGQAVAARPGGARSRAQSPGGRGVQRPTTARLGNARPGLAIHDWHILSLEAKAMRGGAVTSTRAGPRLVQLRPAPAVNAEPDMAGRGLSTQGGRVMPTPAWALLGMAKHGGRGVAGMGQLTLRLGSAVEASPATSGLGYARRSPSASKPGGRGAQSLPHPSFNSNTMRI
jgi:hypothetical protein